MAVDEAGPDSNPIKIREVWANNLKSEFDLISTVIDQYPFVSMDTEFPGVIYTHSPQERAQASTADKYTLLKRNVDALNIIQLGITLSDSAGNLPHLGSGDHRYIWQFNFSDFDVARDKHASNSIKLLRQHGINFEMNRVLGIDSVKFAELMMSSGLVCSDSVSWVTFQGAYDFGYLVKILKRLPLPGGLNDFLELLRVFFGNTCYDVKYLTEFCGHYGGLNRVAEQLHLNRVVGKSHQAGSDSLLTWHIFHKIRDNSFFKGELEKYAGVLYGYKV
ncbi:PREDICTED: probable CCR4-associated factor 1 homolog 11 [Nicotiana attenuata]|uniref:poly(A)-specific ribonuclease n=1 Tax=Nicotiana attenuata TaxID=49451 RepID=A0A1J6KCG1_NICAT|nr:PREDICTED: probable CCR4-associated factor 1 homolog 11 [Nicotiana attenuata]OIT27781.1 putative ccr4-associated factor 1 -like 11 [Nicotiana attenuata]